MSAHLKPEPEPFPSHMTVAEFLAWDASDPTGTRWQLVDGEPVAMAPASETHAALQGEIGALIRNHLLERGSPCRLLSQPGIVPRIQSARNFRIPDLGVTCAPPGLNAMMPEPVLLIEILSPNNELRTRANMWTYATIPSVQEFLAIHSTRVEAELLRRLPDNNWPEKPEIISAAEPLVLSSIGFTVPLAAIYRTTALAAGA